MEIDYLIVGAGLSGLSAAYYLKKASAENIVVLEGRNRPGGRILTSDSIELGATWSDPTHRSLMNLLDELSVDCFKQYQSGNSFLIENQNTSPDIFKLPETEISTLRIKGGSSALIEALIQESTAEIQYGQIVSEISDRSTYLEVKTQQISYRANKVILALPPKLAASSINFSPTLPSSLKHALANTHTWMGTAIKFALTFDKPFWREKGLSGMLHAYSGPVVEMYDHVNEQEDVFAIMGFLNENLRHLSLEQRKSEVLSLLEPLFGPEIRNHTEYLEKDWAAEPLTSESIEETLMQRPLYGDSQFLQSYMGDKLTFCGSETSSERGGYMDGAVSAAKRAVAGHQKQ